MQALRCAPSIHSQLEVCGTAAKSFSSHRLALRPPDSAYKMDDVRPWSKLQFIQLYITENFRGGYWCASTDRGF